MDNFKWIFKWKADEDGDTVFLPIFVPASSKTGVDTYLAVWMSGASGKFFSNWWQASEVKRLKDIKPKSEDLRRAIEYVFQVDNFFEGL